MKRFIKQHFSFKVQNLLGMAHFCNELQQGRRQTEPAVDRVKASPAAVEVWGLLSWKGTQKVHSKKYDANVGATEIFCLHDHKIS